MTVKLEGDFDHLAKKTRNGDHADDADEEGEMDDLKWLPLHADSLVTITSPLIMTIKSCCSEELL